MTRILILGGPRCGKTTYALDLSRQTHAQTEHYDWMIPHFSWSDMSDKIAEGLDDTTPWIREGVAAVRGLRKWLRNNPDRVPDFKIEVRNYPQVPLSPGQRAMHKGTTTMIKEVLHEIELRRYRKAGGA